MEELTYILGAGASFQSIPIVKTFNWRLRNFGSFLRDRANISNDIEARKKYDTAAEAIKHLEKEFSTHHSFDTYFKKLFHLNKFNEINNGKRLLNLYFLWEHSILSTAGFKENESRKDIFIKENQFDKRYDALIAGLLQPFPGKVQSLCKVNFITWNYDINLLQAIKNFFYPDLKYAELLSKVSKTPFLWEIDNQIRIINVNGFFLL